MQNRGTNRLIRVWRRVVLLLAFVAVCCGNLSAQNQTSERRVHFKLDKFNIDLSLRDNGKNFDEILSLLHLIKRDSTYTLVKLEIEGNTSPEAGRSYNLRLSQNRANSIRDYITSHINIADSLTTATGHGIAWDYLREMVASSEMEYRSEVLDILDNVEEERWERREGDRWLTLTDSRLKHLMDLRGGRPYNYMLNELFPLMRNGDVVKVHYMITLPPMVRDVMWQDSIRGMEFRFPRTTPPPTPRTIFAIKSNLLYDAMKVVNVEIEVPVGNRFSLTGEYIFPWFYSVKRKNTMRTNIGHVGLNYWLGERTQERRLVGWHIGAYGGYGKKYDLQRRSIHGVQGDYMCIGANIGYTHKIAGNWHIEAQVGGGYIKSHYKEYTMAYDTKYGDIKVHDFPWETKLKQWFGPTQARISIAYHIKAKRREARR